MNRDDIARELAAGISAIRGKSAGTVSPETRLDELGADSLMLVEIFVLVEKKYGLKLLESDVQKADLETVTSLAGFIARKL